MLLFEIELFEFAHDTSTIKNKIIININNKNEDIVFNEVIEYIKEKE